MSDQRPDPMYRGSDRCDGCGEPLAPEAQLFGFCAKCDGESRRAVSRPVPKPKPGRDR